MDVTKMQAAGGKGKPAQKNYRIELDALRDLAAICILVYHFVIESVIAGYLSLPALVIQSVSLLAEIGIDLFFLLSGASLHYSWQGKWNPKRFAMGRALAIYPDFWTGFLVLFIYGEVLHGNNASVPGWKIVFSLFAMDGYAQQFTGTFYKIGEWFLGCLLILYLFFPLFRRFVLPCKGTALFGSALLLLWIVWPGLCLPYDGGHMALGRAFVFWVGMPLSQLLGRRFSRAHRLLCPLALSATPFLQIPVKYKAFLCAALLFVAACAFAGPLKRLPAAAGSVIRFFSRQSYRVFLVHHVLLTIVILPASLRLGLHPLLSAAMFFACCAASAVVLGYVSRPLAWALSKALQKLGGE